MTRSPDQAMGDCAGAGHDRRILIGVQLGLA